MSAPFYELTGRLAEFDALQDRLREAPRLLLISAAPRSGTSRLLAQFDEAAASILVLVDARPCRDELDLAMQIADAAVAQFEPAASPWWQSGQPPTDRPALNLARRLSARGIDLDALRLGDGLPSERLTEAFQLTHTLLGARPGAIVIDHFGELLSGMTEAEIRRLLGDLRILVQRRDTAALTVVEPPDGHVSAALHDPDHPLFHAGQEFAIRRPEPERFASDMAITKPSLPPGATVPLLTAIAELAHGVPDLVWRTLELTPPGGEPAPAAAEGWSRLQEANAAALAAQWGSCVGFILTRRPWPLRWPSISHRPPRSPTHVAAPTHSPGCAPWASRGNPNDGSGLSPTLCSPPGSATTRHPGPAACAEAARAAAPAPDRERGACNPTHRPPAT